MCVTWRNVFGGLGGIVFDPNTSLRCSRSLRSPARPELGLVLSLRATSELPPRASIFWTPSCPRCSMSSRSCLRVTPYLLPAAMMMLWWQWAWRKSRRPWAQLTSRLTHTCKDKSYTWVYNENITLVRHLFLHRQVLHFMSHPRP